MSYQIGDKIRIGATFRDPATRTTTDPDIVRFRFKLPTGPESVYVFGTDAPLVREAVGVFHVDLPITEKDEWWYRWEADGTTGVVAEKSLQVDDTNFDSVS
jgi:hypothetical protein